MDDFTLQEQQTAKEQDKDKQIEELRKIVYDQATFLAKINKQLNNMNSKLGTLVFIQVLPYIISILGIIITTIITLTTGLTLHNLLNF